MRPPEEQYEILEDGDDQAVVENRKTGDDSDEPRPEIATVSPGDRIHVGAVECRVFSVGKRINYGQRGVCRFSIPADAFGTVATLYADRDPYRLDFCNGKIFDIDPSEVTV